MRLKAKVWLAVSKSLWLLGMSTKCKSFKEAKQRVKRIVERIELQLRENKKIVIIGHGFLNRLIKAELLEQGCLVLWPYFQKTEPFITISIINVYFNF